MHSIRVWIICKFPLVYIDQFINMCVCRTQNILLQQATYVRSKIILNNMLLAWQWFLDMPFAILVEPWLLPLVLIGRKAVVGQFAIDTCFYVFVFWRRQYVYCYYTYKIFIEPINLYSNGLLVLNLFVGIVYISYVCICNVSIASL